MALNPLTPNSALILGTAPTQVQDIALGLVELCVVSRGPCLKSVKVSLDGIPSFKQINGNTQFGVICKLSDGSLNPTVYVTDEGIKQCLSQYRPLRDTICYWFPLGY